MQLYDIMETAEKLSCSKNTVRNLMESGELPFIRLTHSGRSAIRFSDKDIDEFIDSRRVDFNQLASQVLDRV